MHDALHVVGRVQTLPLLEQAAQILEVVFVHVARGLGGGKNLEDDADLVDLVGVVLADAAYRHAAAGLAIDEAIGGKLIECGADGRAADVERLSELLLVDGGARRNTP